MMEQKLITNQAHLFLEQKNKTGIKYIFSTELKQNYNNK